MHELCIRLKMVSEYVRKGSRIADIGTDHAYLPVYLIKENKAQKALACDLRKGPLFNAEKTVTENNLTDRIELRLSDGLEKVRADEADDIIICGMGGTLISEILGKATWLKDSRYRLILQPQSHQEDVRRFLTDNGFEIKEENACFDAGKYYSCLYAEYTGKIEKKPEWYYYFGDLIYSDKPEAQAVTGAKLNMLKTKYNAEISNNDMKEHTAKLEKAISEAEKITDSRRK